MHTFLKAIGFSKKTSQADIDNLIGEVVDRAESNKVIQKSNGCKFVEYSKEFGENFGITVRGEEDENGEFRVPYDY